MPRALFILAVVFFVGPSATTRAQVANPYRPATVASPDQTGRLGPAGRFANPERAVTRESLPATSTVPLPAGVGPSLEQYMRMPANANTYTAPITVPMQ